MKRGRRYEKDPHQQSDQHHNPGHDDPFDQHHVAADVLCEQLARALRGTVLAGGQTEIVVDGEGRVYVDDRLVYEPPVRCAQPG